MVKEQQQLINLVNRIKNHTLVDFEGRISAEDLILEEFLFSRTDVEIIALFKIDLFFSVFPLLNAALQ